jgi:hypothetical protein
MIKETNAIELLSKNLQRTEMLIAATEKIKAFNQIYQLKQTDLEYYRIVKTFQDNELVEIEQSCGEHAIISLVTAFETYYKELVQQLLAQYPNHFVSRHTIFSDKVTKLIDSDELLIYEDIERRLELKDRFGYYEFFSVYSIPFLSREEETLVEYLYLRRNNYVHNAGRPDKKSMGKLVKNPSLFKEKATGTEAKRLRTKLKNILVKSYDRVIAAVKQI